MLTATSGPTVLMDSGTLEAYRGRPPGPKVVEEKEKRLVFLQEVGNSNYELLESLLQGQELESTDLASLSNAMEKHFQPKKLVLAERFGLMSKMQKPGQSLQEFYAELQKAANGCRFEDIKNYRDAMVTMVFIGGLQSLETRKRLLEKEDLTSKEALEQAEAWERVGVNAPHLKEGPQPLGIAQVKPKRMNSKQGRVGRPQALEKNVKRLGKGPARERAACNVCGKVNIDYGSNRIASFKKNPSFGLIWIWAAGIHWGLMIILMYQSY
nr:Putative tick transposon [Haemonchus contortus]